MFRIDLYENGERKPYIGVVGTLGGFRKLVAHQAASYGMQRLKKAKSVDEKVPSTALMVFVAHDFQLGGPREKWYGFSS